MNVREKKRAPAHKGQTEKQPAQTYRWPAPVRGWVLNENRIAPQPGGARVLDNYIVTLNGIRARGGATAYALLDDDVTALFSYKSGTSEKFFAATADGIFDITTVADPNVAVTATLTGQTSGDYSVAQFGTAGGNYLYVLNGTDSPLLYDGSTFTAITGVSTPAITGVTTSNLSQVWVYGSRLWFVEKNTMKVWYLSVDSISGAALSFNLAGIFSKGGNLLFGARWSQDAGDGLDDKIVFVSSEGEVAVYEGTNPASATDWRKVGLYQMPKPLGKNAFVQAGGNLLVATESGLIPISAAINNDIAALENEAISRNIASYWKSQAQAITDKRWQIVKIPETGIMVVSQPDTTDPDGTALVVNLQTGAWSRITGWDTQCVGEFNSLGYYGDQNSRVYLMDSGGSDNGTPYTCTFVGQHDAMGAQGSTKTVRQVKSILNVGSPANPQTGCVVDFSEEVPAPPSSPMNYITDTWDSGLWDTAVWDSDAAYSSAASWVAAGATGSMIAPFVQMTFGITPTPLVELLGVDATFSVGGMVT